jgi:serine protease AprX
MSLVTERRRELEKSWGGDLAGKASDAFCMRHGGPAPPPGRLTAIIDLERPPIEPPFSGISPDAVRMAHDALRAILKGPTAGAAAVAASILRRAAIDRARHAFLVSAGPLLAQKEHSTGSPHSVTGCWLSSSVRISADLPTIAAFASERQVSAVDIPRRMRAEISMTRDVVGASTYSRRHGVSGRGVVVAVLDGEISITHPLLKGRVAHRANYSGEPWGSPQSHGTAVAGIIGAKRDAGGVSGMAPEVLLYNYKVLAVDKAKNADDFECAAALQQALEDGAHIANLSLGVEGMADGTSRLTRACNVAWTFGLVIVKSAGNETIFGGITVPGDAEGVIVVGACDRGGTGIASYSSKGPLATGDLRPHLMAPGGLRDDSMFSCGISTELEAVGWGTSFAAAHVSGLVALLLEREPLLTPDQVRKRLIDNAVTLGKYALAEEVGEGLAHL